MKHLKTLGFAALAVVALTALVGVSSAAAAEFHSGGGVALNGVQTTAGVYEVTGQKMSCNVQNLNGTSAASGTSTTQSMHPEYSSCTAFGLPATINTAGCQFNFTSNLNTVNLSGCTNGITIDSSNAFSHCHITISNQNGINGVSFANMGSTAEGNATLTLTISATNIDVTVNVDEGLCPLSVGFHENSNENVVFGIMGPAGSPQTHIN